MHTHEILRLQEVSNKMKTNFNLKKVLGFELKKSIVMLPYLFNAVFWFKHVKTSKSLVWIQKQANEIRKTATK